MILASDACVPCPVDNLSAKLELTLVKDPLIPAAKVESLKSIDKVLSAPKLPPPVIPVPLFIFLPSKFVVLVEKLELAPVNEPLIDDAKSESEKSTDKVKSPLEPPPVKPVDVATAVIVSVVTLATLLAKLALTVVKAPLIAVAAPLPI